MRIEALRAHLTFGASATRSERLSGLRAHLETDIPAVRAALGHRGSFGVALRLSTRTLAELDDTARRTLRESLRARDLYVFTSDDTPGCAGGRSVARPPHDCLVELWAALLPGDVDGSLSVRGGSRSARRRPAVFAERLLRSAARAFIIGERTGKSIRLAVEPAPRSQLESAVEAVSFLREHLFARMAVRRFERLTGLSTSQAEQALRRHLGVGLDACHSALVWEEPRAAVRSLVAAGIGLAKVRVSAALELDLAEVEPSALARLGPRRVVERDANRWWRHPSAARAGLCRGHVHAPLHTDVAPFRTTREHARELLHAAIEDGACAHFEVETTDWGLLPASQRAEGLPRSIARELIWVERCLATAGARDLGAVDSTNKSIKANHE